MELELLSGISELGFRIVGSLTKYSDFLSHISYLKIATLSFGSLVVFTKRYVDPRVWKKVKIKA